MENTLETVLWMSVWVSRLARNFQLINRLDDRKSPMTYVVLENVVRVLIGSARNVQGLAKQRGLRRVHVDQASVSLLNGRICVSNVLFTQVIGNLLDNAVKYSDKGTEVLIVGRLSDNYGEIHIINRGIPICKEEVKKIFKREYRTEAAKAKYAVGTGIGLTIAQDLIEQQGGLLTTAPSIPIEEPGYSGYETTFKVLLPLPAMPPDKETKA